MARSKEPNESPQSKHGRPGDSDAWGLIVVDLQNDFIAAEGYYARRTQLSKQVARGALTTEAMARRLSETEARAPGRFSFRDSSLATVVENVRRMVDLARMRRRPVAFLKAVYSREFDVQPPSLRQDPERSHYPCKPNSWGSALIEPVAQLVRAKPKACTEKVFEKHSYDGFHGTELLSFLKGCRVQTLLVAGVETQVCVLATAKSAAMNQFDTVILEDCTWTAQKALGQGALGIFRDAFGRTASSQELMDSPARARRSRKN